MEFKLGIHVYISIFTPGILVLILCYKLGVQYEIYVGVVAVFIAFPAYYIYKYRRGIIVKTNDDGIYYKMGRKNYTFLPWSTITSLGKSFILGEKIYILGSGNPLYISQLYISGRDQKKLVQEIERRIEKYSK